MSDIYFKIGYVLSGILVILAMFYMFFKIIFDYRNQIKKRNSKKYFVTIYDLDGKIIMSFKGFNVDGNDNTIFLKKKMANKQYYMFQIIQLLQ